MRPEKKSMIDEVRGRLEGSDFMLMVDYRGLDVERMYDLRARLRGMSARCDVVRNSVLGSAGRELDRPLPAQSLVGPTAIITGEGDVTVVAGALRDFAKKDGLPAAKGGMMGGSILTAEDVQALARLPGRSVLLGQVVGTVAAPMSRLAGVMRQKVCSLLYVLKAVEEKKSQQT